MAIAMCPLKWRRELLVYFLARVELPRFVLYISDKAIQSFDQYEKYLLPSSVARDIEAKYTGLKDTNKRRVTAMKRWLLREYGSTPAWKAAQIVALLKDSGCAWTAEDLTKVMSKVIRGLSKDLDVPSVFLTRLRCVDNAMREALLAGEVSPAATKRLLSFFVDEEPPNDDACRMLRLHVLSGDDAALNLAIGKLTALSKDVGRMKARLSKPSLARIDAMTAFAEGLGSHLIPLDAQDAVVDYILRQGRRTVLDEVTDRRTLLDEVIEQSVCEKAVALGITEEVWERAMSWMFEWDEVWEDWCLERDIISDRTLELIKPYKAFEDALAEHDMEPVVLDSLTDIVEEPLADIQCDGMYLRQLSSAVWQKVHSAAIEGTLEQVVEPCRAVFQCYRESKGLAGEQTGVSV